MEFGKTHRGFSYVYFKDAYGIDCEIAKSSSGTLDCIWMGVKNASPKILASVAKKINPESGEMTGWINYPLPENVFINTLMHLSREQVAELIPILQKFVDTGNI